MAEDNNALTKPKEMPLFETMARSARDAFLEMADEKTWVSEIEFAMQTLRGNELLQKCDRESIRNAVVNVAMCGTTLNPARQMAFLVPRKVNGVMKCCLDFSYRGLCNIAMDSGSVKHIDAFLVYSFDRFDYKIVDGQVHCDHAPALNPPSGYLQKENFWRYLIGGYGTAILHDGTRIISGFMPKEKIEKAMKTSKTSGEYTPWQTHPDEQGRKTIIKHFYKTLPQSERMTYTVNALNEHEGIDTDLARGGKAQELMNRFKPKSPGAAPAAGDPPIDADFKAKEEGDAKEGDGGNAPAGGSNDNMPSGSEELFGELGDALRSAGEKLDLAAVNDAWNIVNGQKDNITGDEYKQLLQLNSDLRKKIEQRKKGGSGA